MIKQILLFVLFANFLFGQNSISKSAFFVDKDNRLIIVFEAKDALKIELKGPEFVSKSNYTIKDSLGHWTLQTSPMPIGFHYFWLEVDGKKLLLPNAETYFGYNQDVHGFEVDSDEAFFNSKTNKKGSLEGFNVDENPQENVYLYKPYRFSTKKKYPLLILFHGAGEDSSGWIKQGKIQNIVDNLIAEKKIKPIVILLLNGDKKNEKSYTSLEEETLSELPLVEDDLLNKILPKVNSKGKFTKYTIAGLSKGSFQAFKIGTDHPELFSNVGLFSPVLYSGVVADSFAKIKTSSFLKQSYFLSVGTLESERFLGFKKILEDEFLKRNVKFKTYESPQTYHEWLTWRRSLQEFLLWIN